LPRMRSCSIGPLRWGRLRLSESMAMPSWFPYLAR
jgi:hypothetical protein